MFDVLIVGSGAWSDILAQRYKNVQDVAVTKIGYRETTKLDFRLLPRKDLYVLASRPENNFTFVKKYDNTDMNFLIEKPLVFNEQTYQYFNNLDSSAKIRTNYQYLETNEWTRIIEACSTHVLDDVTISIANLGPKRRDYLSPALDYGSHVLSMVHDLRLHQQQSINLEILESTGNDNRYKVKLRLLNIYLNLDYGTNIERINTLSLRSAQSEINYNLSAEKNYSSNTKMLLAMDEPIIKTLARSLVPNLDSPHQGTTRDLDIYGLHQKIASF